MKLENLKASETRALSKDTVVVIPVASIEQHGPHLPVGTDSMIGQGVVDELDRICDNRLLLTPMLKFGCSEHHMSFGGTLTFTHETFKECVLQVIQSLYRHGFRRFVIHNSHGGNRAVGGVIAEKASVLWPDADIIFATWFQLAAAKLAPLEEGTFPSVGHACEFETSLMLLLHPDLVDMSLAKDDGPADAQPPFRNDLLRGGGAGWALPFAKMTRNGVIGRPTLASAEKGQKLLDISVAELKHMLEVAWPGSTTK